MSDRVSDEVVEARRRWVEALESGEYEQARQYLRRSDHFCCLGVACVVVGEGTWADDKYTPPGGPSSHGSLLPMEIINKLGMTGVMSPTRPGSPLPLAHRNDSGATFPEIAALLRSDEWFGPDLDRVVA